MQPEVGDVEVFTRPLEWGMLTLQGIGGFKGRSRSMSFRYKITSKLWENTPAMLPLRRAEWGAIARAARFDGTST